LIVAGERPRRSAIWAVESPSAFAEVAGEGDRATVLDDTVISRRRRCHSY
jgi:hypothetical protein